VSNRSKASRISCFCSSVSSNFAAFFATGFPPREAAADYKGKEGERERGLRVRTLFPKINCTFKSNNFNSLKRSTNHFFYSLKYLCKI